MASTTTKTDRHYTRTTPQETKWLDDLKDRKDFTSRSDAIRYCIQRTIEEESDAIGSRRHFTRTMNAKLDEAIAVTTLYGAMLNVTFTESFTALINLLNEAEAGEQLDADTLRNDLYPKILTRSNRVMLAMQAVQRKLDEQAKKSRRTQKPPSQEN